MQGPAVTQFHLATPSPADATTAVLAWCQGGSPHSLGIPPDCDGTATSIIQLRRTRTACGSDPTLQLALLHFLLFNRIMKLQLFSTEQLNGIRTATNVSKPAGAPSLSQPDASALFPSSAAGTADVPSPAAAAWSPC